MLSSIPDQLSGPRANSANEPSPTDSAPNTGVVVPTSEDSYGMTTANSLWNWASSGLNALAPPLRISSPRSTLRKDAEKFRSFATDLMVATGKSDSDENRNIAVRKVLAAHPAVVLWFVTGKDLGPIAKAADLPTIADMETPILTSAFEIGATLKQSFEALDDFRIIVSSLNAAREAYTGLSLGSLGSTIGAMGIDLGSSIVHRAGRDALVDLAVSAARTKAESAFCTLTTSAREELLKNLPDETFSSIAKQIDASILSVKISDSEEVRLLLDPEAGFDLTQVPPTFQQFFQSVLTRYFDELSLRDKRRIAIGLFSLPIDATAETKLAAILNNSGPAIQKLFQLFGEDVKSERVSVVMKELKNQIKPFDSRIAIEKIETALGGTTAELFSEFRQKPIAAASVGQVYLATSKATNQDVIIKVMRPNIRERAVRELELLNRLAPTSGTKKIVKRLEESLLEELDFRNEAQNMERGQVYFLPAKGISLVETISEFETTSDVLVMERAYERPINKFHGPDLPKKSEALGTFLRAWYDQALFGNGFFHADLHAGNIFFNTRPMPDYAPYGRDYQMTLIDFGNCGQLSPIEQKSIIKLIIGCASGSTDLVTTAFKTLCPRITGAQEDNFRLAIAEIMRQGEDANETCNKIVNKAIEHELGLPKNFILFNRGRAFLENQIRDTNYELNDWDPGQDVPRQDAAAIFGGLLKWRLGADFFKSALGIQSFSEAALDGPTLASLAEYFLIGNEEDYDSGPDYTWYF